MARNILAIFLVIVILTESVGIQIIKDICTPCQNETVAVQFLFTHYESDCFDNCHFEEEHHFKKTNCCEKDHCKHNKHGHQKEIQVLRKIPEFFETNSNDVLKNISVLLAVFINKEDLRSIVTALPYPLNEKYKDKPPKNGFQSILCTFLI